MQFTANVELLIQNKKVIKLKHVIFFHIYAGNKLAIKSC